MLAGGKKEPRILPYMYKMIKMKKTAGLELSHGIDDDDDDGDDIK